ncbi:hypothetical protein N480_21075 [Pseudoalteromonas luteoviolacea S2607]|nr:hypothetical protein [Pseudoalteromonas luteoviolacea]KZN34520.1 hypothetical protein N480_21075 [Pseudoalteromonas luteoviolacea S2607]
MKKVTLKLLSVVKGGTSGSTGSPLPSRHAAGMSLTEPKKDEKKG